MTQPKTIGKFPGPNGDLDPVTKSVFESLGLLGLVYPIKIEDDEVVQFPLDITEVSMVELGQLHSWFTAQFARHQAVHGTVIAQKRSTKFQLGKLRKKAAADDSPETRERLEKMEHHFARIDAMDAILEGDVDAFKRYTEACSRELTRRQIEVQLSR